VMYMREARKQVPATPVPLALGTALAVSLFATLYLGIYPDRILRYAQNSAQQLVEKVSPTIPAASPAPAVQGKL